MHQQNVTAGCDVAFHAGKADRANGTRLTQDAYDDLGLRERAPNLNAPEPAGDLHTKSAESVNSDALAAERQVSHCYSSDSKDTLTRATTTLPCAGNQASATSHTSQKHTKDRTSSETTAEHHFL